MSEVWILTTNDRPHSFRTFGKISNGHISATYISCLLLLFFFLLFALYATYWRNEDVYCCHQLWTIHSRFSRWALQVPVNFSCDAEVSFSVIQSNQYGNANFYKPTGCVDSDNLSQKTRNSHWGAKWIFFAERRKQAMEYLLQRCQQCSLHLLRKKGLRIEEYELASVQGR